MIRFQCVGKSIQLPAASVFQKDTRDKTAWQNGQYATVRLLMQLKGVRVHTDGREFSGRPASKAEGVWIALDDFIQTSGEFVSSRSLPGSFTHVSWVVLPVGCIINVGFCSAKFGANKGGGAQAEYVSGPTILFDHLGVTYWSNQWGHA